MRTARRKRSIAGNASSAGKEGETGYRGNRKKSREISQNSYNYNDRENGEVVEIEMTQDRGIGKPDIFAWKDSVS